MNYKNKNLIPIFLILGFLFFSQPAYAETITKTLYAWARDLAGNVSLSLNDSVEITTEKFTKTFATRIGGTSLSEGDEIILAKNDVIILNRFAYQDINGDTYASIKNINPDAKIFLYQMGSEVSYLHDSYNLISLNTLGRWNVSRGHSMGSVNGNNSNFILLDSTGNYIYNTAFPGTYLMDVGLNSYQQYWIEATNNDISNQPWVADGVFMDGCPSTLQLNSYNSNPVKYNNNNSLWVSAINSFINSVSGGLSGQNQLTGANSGNTRFQEGYDSLVLLDSVTNPPYFVLEEGAFAVEWGPNAVQFYGQVEWKRQVDLLKEIDNFRLLYLSHTKLSPGQSGLDNYQKTVNFYDVLWYSLASFHLGKKSNSFFEFSNGSYNNLNWYDEYTEIDLGNPISNYQIVDINGVAIFMREFEKGYVYVNSSNINVSNITLPKTSRQLNHDNLFFEPSLLPQINSINLDSHRGTFLLKVF